MKRIKELLIFILFFGMIPLTGQTGLRDTPLILEDLYKRITDTKDESEKLRLNDSIKLIISSYAASDSVFIHRFETLRYLGQIISPDMKLKIITWNVFMRNSPNRYFCYIVRKGERKQKNSVYFLAGQNHEEPIRTDITYNSGNWYGALYYAIQPFRKKRQTHYILLGLDYGNINVARKLIDVLSFTSGGDLLFGLDCIEKNNVTRQREVFEYSPEGIVSLRMETPKKIVFDRVTTISTGHGDGSELSGAGITFDAYVFKRGSWRFISDVDVKNKKKD
jgi:hypothetical protein